MSNKSLLIVESPTKVKTIQQYLGKDYDVISCVGHVKDLPRKELGIDIENDFKIALTVLPDKKKFITSCIFRVKSEPSALYKCLGGFATNQVNLTKLESFSVKNTFDQANFYLDLEGHLEDVGVKKALEELGFHTETLDILGVYESSKFREK